MLEGRTALVPPAPSLQRIVLGFDGRSGSVRASRWARRIARAEGSRIAVVSAPTPRAATTDVSEREGSRRRSVDALVATLTRSATRYDIIEGAGAPADEILRAARLAHSDLIIVGAGPIGRARRLGEEAARVLEAAPASVLLARGIPTGRKLLVATDGGPNGEMAHALAIRLAHDLDASTEILHVANKNLDPTPSILAAARSTSADLVLLGRRSGDDASDRSLGGVARAIARECTASVLVARSVAP